ncbi:uncharacterized protein si:dkeyp-77h1.4 [Synchiropus splendidus]|uniref:uncharacterized protein si:dkeyp-77h1.4 n=1 Tax=Synchiropus splendidus TaxID=270530 RepID=UPI00237DB53E|nr:uncharacterized protein si:dkeyp-77h1.4 [Synchiropus splendidus]
MQPVIVLSFLLTLALSAPVKVHEEVKTLFRGEDFHIHLSSPGLDITFRATPTSRSNEVYLMRGGRVTNQRVKINRQLSHLSLESVLKADEGIYTVKDPNKPEEYKRIMLYVRDCTNEQVIKYGDNFNLPLLGVAPPFTLTYQPSPVEANQTSKPSRVVLSLIGESVGGYKGRISVNSRHVTLSAVTGADEGTYTITDKVGDIKRQVCLNVKEHLNFVTLPHGNRLKVNLILNSSLVRLYYTRENDQTQHLLMDKGEFTNAPAELGFGDRLSMEGSVVYLDEFKSSDTGKFTVTDLLGFPVSVDHCKIEPFKLDSLYVAIIALLGLLVFLLLACLLSCLIKVKKRAKRAAALEKIAQNAGKEDEGEAFRQVVKNITKLSEESKHSQADNTEKSQSTEVDIKGLEVSSKEVGIGNLETSDSGVGFNTALPLDTDTDVPDQIPDSEAVSVSVAPETKPSPPPAEPKPIAPAAPETRSSPVAETKPMEAPVKQPEKLDVSKPEEVKLSPTPSPEPKATLSPAASKPAPSPAAITPPPEIKSASAPTPEAPKPSAPEPIINGTPEPGPDLKIESSPPKAAPPKTPEAELKSSVVGKESAASEESKTA